MKKALFFIFIAFVGSQLVAQDYNSPLTSNPSLFKYQTHRNEITKQLVAEDSIIYEYDTLSLPFIDDFSTDHLPQRITDLTASNVTDTLFYKLYEGATVVRDTVGFSLDTTYRVQVSALGDTLTSTHLPFRFLTIFDLSTYPPTSETKFVYPPYHLIDTVGQTQSDTLHVGVDLKQDSVFYYLVDKNPHDWYINRDVLINGTFPLNPPTIGVATFDGLNQYGLPYSPNFSIRVEADELTSVPIDLSNPSANDEVFFSFYYQPKGLSLNQPEGQDSLALDFYNPSSNKWVNVWHVGGSSSDTFLLEMIQVDTAFHKKGFQFKFRTYAQGSGAYDHWHIDYLYLNDNRDADDTTFKDAAFVYPAVSLLEDYTVMPWWHYKSNPSLYGRTNTSTLVRNNFRQGQNVYYKFTMVDSLSSTPYYIFPGANVFDIIRPQDTLTFNYTINYVYKMDSVKGPGKFESFYDVNLRAGVGQEQDLIRSNDTLRAGICLDNYYAYDDGSAEAGYGINPQLTTEGFVSYMAVQFQIPFVDTLGGLQIYFLPQYPDIRTQSFELYVWDNLSPGGVRFTSPEKITPLYTDDNGFVHYWFDTNIVVNQTFYVGIRSVGEYSMNIGYDLNYDHKNKINWSYDGVNWSAPSAGIFNGSLMIRPIFRKKNWGVGFEEVEKEKVQVDLFPNPVKEILNLQFEDQVRNSNFQIYSIGGQQVVSGNLDNQLNVSDLPNGVYFIRIEHEGYSINKKFVIAK